MGKEGSHTRLLNRAAPVRCGGQSIIAEIGGIDAVRRIASTLRTVPQATGTPSPGRRLGRVYKPCYKLTLPVRREIWRLYDKGLSQRQIALAVGLSKYAVFRTLANPELPLSERRETRRQRAQQAAALREQQYSLREIGRKMGCHTDTVNRLLKEAAAA